MVVASACDFCLHSTVGAKLSLYRCTRAKMQLDCLLSLAVRLECPREHWARTIHAARALHAKEGRRLIWGPLGGGDMAPDDSLCDSARVRAESESV